MNQDQTTPTDTPPEQVRVRKRKVKNSNAAPTEDPSPIIQNNTNITSVVEPTQSSTPTVSIHNVTNIIENSDNKNEVENPQPKPPIAQSSSQPTMVADNASTVQQVRKRKVKPKTAIPQSDSDLQNVISPTAAPIETNEIPNLSFSTSFSSNENLSFSSSNSRIGLDIEEDNRIAARYMNPNFDLSRIGKLESKQLLSKSVSRDYADRFTTEMTAREEEFKRTYVKPEPIDKQQLINSAFLSSELQDIISLIKSKVQSQTEEFDLGKCNFDDVVMNPSSFPVNEGLSKSYARTTKESLDLLSGIHQIPSNDALQSALLISLPTETSPIPNDRLIIQEIDNLTQKVTKQTSPNQYVLDLSSNNGLELISKIALFLFSGLNWTPKYFVDLLYSQMNEDSREHANLITFQTALLQAKAELIHINDNYQYSIRLVLYLIEATQCSTLIRYMATAQKFKEVNYYADALILNSDLCKEVTIEIEKIECMELQGSLSFFNIASSFLPIPGYRFAIRIESVVNSYLRQSRQDLLEKGETSINSLDLLIQILSLFVEAFLTQKNGHVLPFESLYDIFMNIETASHSPSYRYREYPWFIKFKEILSKVHTLSIYEIKSQLWYILASCLNEDIFPYIILFGEGTETSDRHPQYYTDRETCARIAYALLPMKYLSFNLDYKVLEKMTVFDL